MNSALTQFSNSAAPLIINRDLSAVSFAEFWRQVAGERLLLAANPAPTLALWTQDSGDFLLLLLAALAAGKTVLLPPNRVPALEQELASTGVQFVERSAPARLADLAEAEINDSLAALAGGDWPQRSPLVFYTSGSTGAPKQIVRCLAQLLREVESLQQTLPLPADTAMVATVSHQHIYGLLFKLLLPLATGRCFYRPQLPFPEDAVQVCRALAAQRAGILVASPALLKRWSADLALSNCALVTSSGGALESGVRANINAPLVEIYGSSETGGIALRWQDDALWQPLAGVQVQIAADGALSVCSPHAFSAEPIATGDRARGEAAGFALLGRADRIIKLEEKRISLDAVEKALAALDEVEQCYIGVKQHGLRQFLVAVVVPRAEVLQALRQGELAKRDWLRGLKQQLALRVESVALPRQWRLLSQLPHNSQGKLERQYLLSLFEPLLLPVVIRQAFGEADALWALDFPPELACFDGHFPSQPIYPGVGQLGFIQHFAKQRWPDLAFVSSLEQIKFQELIQPFSHLQLQLTRKPDSATTLFQLRDGERAIASGRLQWQCSATVSTVEREEAAIA